MISIFPNCKIKLVLSIFFTLFIFGCTMVEKKIEEFFAELKSETAEKQISSREEALRRYGLEGLRKGLIVENPIIIPNIARLGDKVKQKLRFILLSPKEEERFNVVETIEISNGRDRIELIKRSSEKAQGIHLSTIEFILPADLDAGEYELITTISIPEKKKIVKVKGFFKVQ